jgi:hypothetical protein
MSWWKGLVASIIQAVAGWGQQEITKPSKPPVEFKRPVTKYGKKVN